MSVRNLHADVEFLEREINWLSREIHDPLRVMNSPGLRRPRPGISTSTPYVRRRNSVNGYVSGDVWMCDEAEDPVPSNRPPVQSNANPRTSNTNPGSVQSRNCETCNIWRIWFMEWLSVPFWISLSFKWMVRDWERAIFGCIPEGTSTRCVIRQSAQRRETEL